MSCSAWTTLPRLVLLGISAMLCLACPVRSVAAEEALPIKTLKTSSGRFMVVGTDMASNQIVGRWAEITTAKIEKMLGVRLIFGRRNCRIILKKGVERGSIVVTEEITDSGLLQRLVVYEHKEMDMDDMLDGFTKLMLNGHATGLNRLIAKKSDSDLVTSSAIKQQVRPLSVPLWFSRGVAQNIDSWRRARNVELALDKWEKGKLPGIRWILDGEGSNHKGTVELERAISGLMVDWLLSRRDKAEHVQKIFSRIAVGREISPEYIAMSLATDGGKLDLGEEWDRWLLRQKRVVFAPGQLDERNIKQLKGELLLYPGNFGMPISSKPGVALTFEDMIKLREAKWMTVFADSKAISLHLLSVGRGEEMKKVIGLYCDFLGALKKRKSRRKLKGLLKKADEALEELESRFVGQRSEIRDQRSEIRDQRSEVRGQRSEIRGQRSEVRGQRSEIRGQRSEIRDQRSEVRGQRSEVRGQRFRRH